MFGDYGANLRNRKCEVIKMSLDGCDYTFDPETCEWQMQVNLDLDQELLNELKGQGDINEYKKLLNKLRQENGIYRQKIEEISKRKEDMKNRVFNAEKENEGLTDQYTKEYLQTEKLDNLRKETQWIIMSMIFMNATFWLQEPKFICNDGQICNQQQAKNEGRCQEQYLYDNDGYTSMTVEMGMYCENSAYLPWSQSIVYIGSAIGSLFLTQMADLVGRKMPIFGLQFIAAIFLLIINFNSSIWLFFICYFMLGLTVWPVETIMYTIINESVNGSLRDKALIGCMLFWSIGEVGIALIAYLIKDWRTAMLITMVIPQFLYCLGNYFFIIESPLFFLQKDPKKVVRHLNLIAKINGKEKLDENIKIIADEEETGSSLDKTIQNDQGQIQGGIQDSSLGQDNLASLRNNSHQNLDSSSENLAVLSGQKTQESSENVLNKNKKKNKNKDGYSEIEENPTNYKKYYLYDLFKYKNLRGIVVVSSLILGGTQIVFFGTSLALNSLPLSVYVAMGVVGLCETVSNFVCALFVHRLERKKFFIIFYAMTVVLCLSYVFIPVYQENEEIPQGVQVASIVLAGLTRVFNIFTMGIYALYAQEIFPTPVRSMGTGFTYAFSTLVTFFAPFVNSLATHIGVYPVFLLGAFSAPILFICCFMKETLGKPIKEYGAKNFSLRAQYLQLLCLQNRIQKQYNCMPCLQKAIQGKKFRRFNQKLSCRTVDI
ncbi:Major facilitator superfamily domain, general substrate transporter [Pseudocohnilembus persalinus]|uniref:Major facilitator superfamily domain, general substrate transporter n=1 Tax=Pseudocohnilembus persalinus TaxID=266149 RepID=A0A0V0QL14_PSEPJ|nr:Major facilitator superfamily domain, general substrate transporter [Pseudocohnilembus persalinus]|eukprot:KRX02926.1 Major facilitator superfamily domain, general substrate transporter [Pseudocohnilembus persalinus]